MIDETGKLPRSRCELCGSQASDWQFAIDGVDIVRCSNCTLVYSRYPNQAARRYMQEYTADYFLADQYRGGYQDYEAEAVSHEKTFEHRLIEARQRLGIVGTLLDVGCAFGHLGQVARRLGWQAFSTDISFFAANRAHQKDGQPVFVSDVSRSCTRYGYFDLICLYDVIEHLPDPVTILGQLRPLLKPTGVIHISTPNIKSMSARLMRASWYHCKPQEHICYFSSQTLREALTRSGFEVLDISPLPSYMTIQDILYRLRFYSRRGAYKLLRLCRWLGLHQAVVKIHVGEIEAWAASRQQSIELDSQPTVIRRSTTEAR